MSAVVPGDASSLRRRVVVHAVGAVEVVDEPVLAPAAGEVLVRVLLAGICGTDLHAVEGTHPFVPMPYHPGHEVVGVVEAVGAGVDPALRGMRVTVEPTLVCGSCKPCRTDRENLCERLEFLGCGHAEGAMADSFVIRADRLFRIPDELNDTHAVLIEPLATPVHAVRLAGGLAGKTVAVVGAGTIGLLVLAVVRAHDARFVAVVDLVADKRDRASRLGADTVVDAAAPDVAEQVRRMAGESIDVVFDCVATEATVRAAVDMALRGGTVVVVGVPEGDVTVPLALVQDRQVRLQGAATYRTEDYDEALRLLVSGAVHVNEIVDRVHDLDDAPVAFDEAASGHFGKVALRGRDASGDPQSRLGP